MGLLSTCLCLIILVICVQWLGESVTGIGTNLGVQSTHKLTSDTVKELLVDNGIKKVKLFDADYDILKALANSGIEVMVGIPNDLLLPLARSKNAAEKWVSDNVTRHISSGVNIRYVAVGNEPFLETYNGTFVESTFPALQNIQAALIKAGKSSQVKVTVPLNADVYDSPTGLPSNGDFRPDIHRLVLSIVSFLSTNGGPFTVNIYPFISLYSTPNFPVDYAFFDNTANPVIDGQNTYYNMFDANYDTLVWSLQRNGFANLQILVGEIGWPTDGDIHATLNYAQRFNQGFITRIANGKGTPARSSPIEAYLFSLIDEDAKSIQPGNFERHWGVFNFDGSPKYGLNLALTGTSKGLVPAKNVQYLGKKWCLMKSSTGLSDPRVALAVSYACSLADCTPLAYGSSCGNLDAMGNVSYAFNSYFQIHNQKPAACDFKGLAVTTDRDPSQGTCRFQIMIEEYYSGSVGECRDVWRVFSLVSTVFICFMIIGF